MQSELPAPVYRKDYKEYDYHLESIFLDFDLHEKLTRVTARSRYQRTGDSAAPLLLFGEELELTRIVLNGRELEEGEFSVDKTSLAISDVPDDFILEVETIIYPDQNSSLEGLYRSSNNYCTQCEAEGFRKITYHPDRPDVLAKFTTRIESDLERCPVMLANGNLIESGQLDNGRHFAVWEDPFPKPSYLFALVAGRLVCIKDTYVTGSGRTVDLGIFVEERNRDKCGHAMTSLIKAMRWDEEVYGLEYDLDNFMIVAVDDFNMGAMENKGLNIFNSKYVLTSPESATDADYLGVEGVVGHEYFHNWTGNRVTCRDWFQLSLKEGLTVFRDQEFSSDMNSRPVKRIEDVRILKNGQFREDSGPMAHPVRPDSFVEINNFYTATVYNKGAEVIRMIHSLVGPQRFRAGMDLYFARHDGKAVTCDDFVAAMSDASGVDLDQFKLWYSQAGTPVLEVETEWNSASSKYRVDIRQTCPKTPGQPVKKPFHMPIKIGLINREGRSLLSSEHADGSMTLELRESSQSFVFDHIEEQPVLSFLRDFSAPVRVEKFQSRKELAFLGSCDPNLFNRWDSINRLGCEVILEVTESMIKGNTPVIDELFLQSLAQSLEAPIGDKALFALSLQLPAETTLAQEMAQVHPEQLHLAKRYVMKTIGAKNRECFMRLYEKNSEPHQDHAITPEAMGKRSLRNVCLAYLMSPDPLERDMLKLCEDHYFQARNMTDAIAAFSHLVDVGGQAAEKVIDDFYRRWSKDPLVLDKWFSLQAMSRSEGTLDRVKSLLGHAAFSIKNPNKVRALIATFAGLNHYRFHRPDGSGYRFLGDRILELNGINPQIAARLLQPLIGWRRYEPVLKEKMKGELERVAAQKELSRDVFEIVSKSLASY